MQNKEIYLVNNFIKLNNGKLFQTYLTDVLDEDIQYNMTYKQITLDFELLQLKVSESNFNNIDLNFIYNTNEIYVNSESLVKFLIDKIFFYNMFFDNNSTKEFFYKKYII